MLCRNFKEFSCAKGIFPKHILHSHSHIAAQKTDIVSSRMVFKDEKSYVDCVAILQDVANEIAGYFHKAYGKKISKQQSLYPFPMI